MKNSFIILGFFTIGLLFGLFDLIPAIFIENDFSMYALYVLMFLVGISVGADSSSWSVIKKTNIKIILVPISVIVGSLAGAAAVSFMLSDISLRESMAVGTGFGYYSLSSIFISKLCNETLGVIALLSNILRELITLIATPIFVKYFGKLAGIASGGATSMDTTLPIIVEYSGKEWAIISIFSGIVLTIIVPFLVTFIIEIGA